jgi:hypothetical protein
MIYSNSIILFLITNIIIVSNINQVLFVNCIGSNLNHIDKDVEEIFEPDYMKEITNDKRINDIDREINYQKDKNNNINIKNNHHGRLKSLVLNSNISKKVSFKNDKENIIKENHYYKSEMCDLINERGENDLNLKDIDVHYINLGNYTYLLYIFIIYIY